MHISYLVILGLILISFAGINNAYGEVTIIQPEAWSPDCGYEDECIEPREITISVGEEVLWVSWVTGDYSIVSGNVNDGPTGYFDTGELSMVEPFLLKFEEEGEFPFYSPVRPWIQGVVTVDGSLPQDSFPDWTKFLIIQWANYQYEDSQFIRAMEYLIENNFIQQTQQSPTELEVPDWVRVYLIRWWGQEAITDEEFVNAMQNLIDREIIKI